MLFRSGGTTAGLTTAGTETGAATATGAAGLTAGAPDLTTGAFGDEADLRAAGLRADAADLVAGAGDDFALVFFFLDALMALRVG